MSLEFRFFFNMVHNARKRWGNLIEALNDFNYDIKLNYYLINIIVKEGKYFTQCVNMMRQLPNYIYVVTNSCN